MKIAHIGDVHLQGKNLDKIIWALHAVVEKLEDEKPEIVAFSGDIYDRGNIADRHGSVGTLQNEFLQILNMIGAIPSVKHIFIVKGNHDEVGAHQLHALSFLKFVSLPTASLKVIDEPETVSLNSVKMGFLPWINKAHFIAKNCPPGASRDECQEMFNAATERMLGIFEFGSEAVNLLFGHCEIAGARQGNYVLVGGCYEFIEDQLNATGADLIRLGHIHKRQGFYAGALCQTNFGEEGNPQGFEIIEFLDKSNITCRHVPIESAEFHTFEIHDQSDADNAASLILAKPKDYFKLRFHKEELFEVYQIINDNLQIEKLWNRQEYVARTETQLTAAMGVGELLAEYVKLNPTEIPFNELISKVELLAPKMEMAA